jgi:hypothetical protein
MPALGVNGYGDIRAFHISWFRMAVHILLNQIQADGMNVSPAWLNVRIHPRRGRVRRSRIMVNSGHIPPNLRWISRLQVLCCIPAGSTIKLTANSSVIQTNYEVSNNADQPINYVWCIHPLLAIEPGMELHLPPSARFNVGGAYPEELISLDKKLQYPFAADGLNFPLLPETSAGRAIKLWSDPLPDGDGWASLRANNGELQIRWDVSLLPQVAVWMNFGALGMDGGSPYFNMGLEPCIGAQDSLADAVSQYNLFATVPPRGSKTWWLEIELTT